MIDKIADKKPDPDNGMIYDRILTTPDKAIELLNWGECGEKQIKRAFKLAKEKFGIETKSFENESI